MNIIYHLFNHYTGFICSALCLLTFGALLLNAGIDPIEMVKTVIDRFQQLRNALG